MPLMHARHRNFADKYLMYDVYIITEQVEMFVPFVEEKGNVMLRHSKLILDWEVLE